MYEKMNVQGYSLQHDFNREIIKLWYIPHNGILWSCLKKIKKNEQTLWTCLERFPRCITVFIVIIIVVVVVLLDLMLALDLQISYIEFKLSLEFLIILLHQICSYKLT